eukprot:scaffold6562_cov163-Amphora_coffeaeformis.AAC.2
MGEEITLAKRGDGGSLSPIIALEKNGVSDITISRGRVVWENDGKVDDIHKGRGEYIPRKAFGSAYDSVKYRATARDKSEQPVVREPYTGPVAGVSS